MHVKKTLSLSLFLLALALPLLGAACAPAVPFNQMPGQGGDLFSSAQNNRQLAAEAVRQAELAEAALTATAQAPIVNITATAAALVVQATQAQQTNDAAVQTQVGAMTATAVWWTPTPNFSGTQTQRADDLEQAAIDNAIARDQLQLQREIQNNEWNRLLGPIVLLFAAVLILLGAIHYMRRTRFQPMQTDARGNVLPVIDIVEAVATDVDSNPNYQGSVSRDLLARILTHIVEKRLGVRLLPEITAERQDAAKERDQMIDLATRGLPGSSSDTREQKKLAGQQMMKQLSDTNLASRFKVLDGTPDHPDVIDAPIIEVLDQEWKEAVKK